jgi:hypothetical protein
MDTQTANEEKNVQSDAGKEHIQEQPFLPSSKQANKQQELPALFSQAILQGIMAGEQGECIDLNPLRRLYSKAW